MFYAQDVIAYIGETCAKTLTVTNNRQVGQDLGGHESMSLTIETQGTTRTVLQSVSGDSSDDDIDRSDDATGVLVWGIDAAVTAAANAGKTFNLYLRGDEGELIVETKVHVKYAGGA